MQRFVQDMAAKNVAGPGPPGGIIEYLDYSDQPDNSRIVAVVKNGMFQEVDDFDEDQWLSQIDLEKLVQEAEQCTKDIASQPVLKEEKKSTGQFAELTNPDILLCSQNKRSVLFSGIFLILVKFWLC